MFFAVFLAMLQDVSGGVKFASVVDVLRRLRLDDRVDTMLLAPCSLFPLPWTYWSFVEYYNGPLYY